MPDSYLFLTPLLTFLVVALVGFVGCDQLFGLSELPPAVTPPSPPTGVTAEGRDGEVVVRWTLYNGGGDKLKVKWGPTEGSYPFSFVLDDPSTIQYVIPGPNGAEICVVVSALKDTVESADSDPVACATPGLYGALMPFVDPTMVQLGAPRQFTGFLGMGFRTGSSSLTLREVGRWFDKDINGSHAMRLVSASAPTVIMASVIVAKNAVSANDQFVYSSVPSPITLNANSDYYLVSQENAAADPFRNSDTTRVVIQNPAAGTLIYAAFADDVGNYTTDPNTPGAAYGPVDFKYTLP